MKTTAKRILLLLMAAIFLGTSLSFSASAAKTTVGRVSNLKANQTTTTITLSWKKADNANGYRIMKKINGKWKEHGTTKSTSYIITGLSCATKHTFAVRSYKKSGAKIIWSDKGKTISTGTKPKNVSNLKVTAKEDSIKMTWKKVTRATGYKIYEYNYLVEKWTPIAQTKGTNYTLKNLLSGKKYNLAVKAFYKVGNKTILSNNFSKIIYTLPIKKTPVDVSTGSSAFLSENLLIVDVDGSGWNPPLKPNSQFLPMSVNGKSTGKNVKCILYTTPDSAGNYTLTIDVSSVNLSPGTNISISFPQGFMQTQDGSQYSRAFTVYSTY